MFVCKRCIEERMEYARGAMQSVGPCELCGTVTVCLDVRPGHYRCKPGQGAFKKRDAEKK